MNKYNSIEGESKKIKKALKTVLKKERIHNNNKKKNDKKKKLLYLMVYQP